MGAFHTCSICSSAELAEGGIYDRTLELTLSDDSDGHLGLITLDVASA